MFHGNVGEHLEARGKEKNNDRKEKHNVRTTTCRNGGCGGTCPFYHDPARFPGSREVRNFTSSSWLYTPGRDGASSGRRIGAATRLADDLATMRAQDVGLIADQAMSITLLALIAKKYRAPAGQQ